MATNGSSGSGTSSGGGGGGPNGGYNDLDKGEISNLKETRDLVNYGDGGAAAAAVPPSSSGQSQSGSAGGRKAPGTASLESDSVFSGSGSSKVRTPSMDRLSLKNDQGGVSGDKPIDQMTPEELQALAEKKKAKAEKKLREAAEKQRKIEEKTELSYLLAKDEGAFDNLRKTWDRPTATRVEFMDYVYAKDYGMAVRDFIVTEWRILAPASKESERIRQKFSRKVFSVLKTAQKAKEAKLKSQANKLGDQGRPSKERSSRPSNREDVAKAQKRGRSQLKSTGSQPAAKKATPAATLTSGELQRQQAAEAAAPAPAVGAEGVEMETDQPEQPSTAESGQSFVAATADPLKSKLALQVRRVKTSDKDGGNKEYAVIPNEDWVKTLAPKFFAEVDKQEEAAEKAETEGKDPFWPRFELTEWRDGKVVIVPSDDLTYSWTKSMFSQLRVATHRYAAVPIEEVPETVMLSVVVPIEVLSDDMQSLWRRVCARNKLEAKSCSFVKLGDFKDRKKKKVLFRVTRPVLATLKAADTATRRRSCFIAIRSTQEEIWYKQRPLCKWADEQLEWERRM